MLPVSAWPPGPPGASLSPFGKPRQIRVCDHPHGFVIPKGAWIVRTGSNFVVMFTPRGEPWDFVSRTPGTGYLPGQIPPRRRQPPPCPPPPCPPARNSFWTGPGQVTFNEAGTAAVQMSLSKAPPCPPPVPPNPPPCPPAVRPRFQKHNTVLEEWRAWQRATDNTDPPIRPLPGRRPPNWFGWRFDPRAPRSTLIQPGSSGLVIADGQNVVIGGSGFAQITQAYSV
jgi:hypothetical protein